MPSCHSPLHIFALAISKPRLCKYSTEFAPSPTAAPTSPDKPYFSKTCVSSCKCLWVQVTAILYEKQRCFEVSYTVTLCPAFLIAIADVSPPMPPPMTTIDKLLVCIATIPKAHSPTSKGWCVVAMSVLPCSRPSTQCTD